MFMYGNTESALTTESLAGYLPDLVTTESLAGYLPDLVLGYSTHDPRTFVLTFGPNLPRGESRQGHYRSMRGPSPKDFSLELEGFSNKLNVWQ